MNTHTHVCIYARLYLVESLTTMIKDDNDKKATTAKMMIDINIIMILFLDEPRDGIVLAIVAMLMIITTTRMMLM